MPAIDEQDLREGLRALSGAQPPLGADLPGRSVRRARSMRRRRAAVSFAVAVAVVAPAAVVATRDPATPPAPPAAATGVAAWPDRSDPELRWFMAGAVKQWRADTGNREDETIRPLYTGAVPLAGDTAVAVFAVCLPSGCNRVVFAHASRATALDPDPDIYNEDVSPWNDVTLVLGPDVPGAANPVFGWYFPSGVSTEEGATTVVFVLAPPEARSVSWRAGDDEGGLGERDGAFTGDIGYVDGPVDLTVSGDAGVIYEGPVGVPGLGEDEQRPAGRVRFPAHATIGAGWSPNARTEGQTDNPSAVSVTPDAGEEYAAFVRCTGPAPLEVTAGDTPVPVTCDGAVHRVPLKPEREGQILVQMDSGSQYVGYSVAVASRPRG